MMKPEQKKTNTIRCNSNPRFYKDGILGTAVLLLVSGSLLLAIIDEGSRPMFADLTKVCLGGYIGLLMPKN